MKKPLMVALIAAIAISLAYLLFKPKTAGTAGLSVSGRVPIVPQGNPLGYWAPNQVGVVSGNPVPLAPGVGIMPPAPQTPFKVATSPAPATNPTYGGAATQNPSNVTISDSGVTYNGVQVGAADPTTPGIFPTPSPIGYLGSDAGIDTAGFYSDSVG